MYAAARHLHGAVRAKARSHVLPAPHWTRMRLARCRGGAARSFGTAPVIARATQAVPFGAFALFGGGIAGLGFVALHRTTAEEATSRVLHEPISMAQGDAESFPPDRTELGVGESDSSERDGSSVEQHTDDVGDSDAPGGDHDGDSVDDCEDEAVGESGAPAGAAQAAREDGDVTSNLSDESAAAPAEGEQAQESSNTHEPAENSDENDEVSYEHPFWKLLKNPMLWVAVGSTLLSSVAGLYIPTAVGTFLDLLQTASAITDVWQPAMAIGGVALLHGVLHMCSVACVTSAVERMAADLRCQLFTSIISRDISFFDEENTAKLVQKITSEVDQLRSLAKHVVSKGLTGVTALIGGTAAMYTASPQLSIATLAVIAPMIAVGLLWTWTLAASSSQGRKKSLKAAAAAQEIFGSVRTVRSFGNESLEVEFYERLVEESCKQNQRHGLSLGIFFGATATALMWASLFSLVYGGMMVIDDSMKLGKLASFLMSTGKSRSGLTDIGILWGEVQDGISTLESVMAVLSSTAHQQVRGSLRPTTVDGHVQFHDVSFFYPSRYQWVLKSVNLSLAPGRVVALVGSSGAGKSTVCQLLERFYDVQGGAITLDGLDIADIDPQWLRSQIGVVSQEPVLFQRSIKENIRYGDPSATDEQVVEAAKMANCHQFITMFPDGYNTVVGERGAQLSGGQKQRIAIARAILRNPRILILDEATSSLDNASEAAVQEALSRLMRGRTVLVVAHRLSTVKDADEIVVLRSGARVESGTYDELMARNGVFALLARREQRGDVEP